jgi:hypothetical protein
LPPRGTSTLEDFDPLAHLEIEEAATGEESADGEADEAPPAPIYKLTVPNIEKYWLVMDPSESEYIEVIIKTFATGLEQIKQYERWSKHEDLLIYAQVLEEWDEIVGDQRWEPPEENKLNPKTWIQDDPLFLEQKDLVEGILKSAFQKMRLFLERFQPILEIFWRNKQVDLQILVNEQLRNPVEGLTHTIDLFNHHHELFSSKLPTKAEIGLILLDSANARSSIQPTPKQRIASIEKFIPSVLKQRNDQQKAWLEARIKELEKPVSDVSQFVQQLEYYNAIEEAFQNVRDNIDLYGQMYNVFSDKSLKVKKEDKDAFNESLQRIAQLA